MDKVKQSVDGINETSACGDKCLRRQVADRKDQASEENKNMAND